MYKLKENYQKFWCQRNEKKKKIWRIMVTEYWKPTRWFSETAKPYFKIIILQKYSFWNIYLCEDCGMVDSFLRKQAYVRFAVAETGTESFFPVNPRNETFLIPPNFDSPVMQYCIISYHIISCYIILYYIILYLVISYHIILYYIISYHVISYYIILYYIILYYIISYYIILYYIILYYIISCYFILCHRSEGVV